MDRAYGRQRDRPTGFGTGSYPVPPFATRVEPWKYDREMYKRLRLFRRLKGFRRIFSRFEKLDVIFLGFIL